MLKKGLNNMNTIRKLDLKRSSDIIESIKKVKIALIGDLCIDVYWHADMTKSEISRETPHFPLPIVKERMSPGAGGNVSANIAALNPLNIKVFGVIGKDWRGDVLLKKLNEQKIDTENVVISGKVITNAYCKPIRKGISDVEYEDPRLDFCNYEDLPEEDEEKLINNLEKNKNSFDIMCVSDQFYNGCITPRVREKIIKFAYEGIKIIVDSRDRINLFRKVILKPNEIEGLKALNKNYLKENKFDDYVSAAMDLAARNESSVCMTLGDKGALFAEAGSVIHIEAQKIFPPIDICGAGDTFLSAFSCSIAAGALPHEAAFIGNAASGVTIKKIGVTGTASPEEIIEKLKDLPH
jgi:D-glycero-beta-D-manno-heptose-7-phosphate kinase